MGGLTYWEFLAIVQSDLGVVDEVIKYISQAKLAGVETDNALTFREVFFFEEGGSELYRF